MILLNFNILRSDYFNQIISEEEVLKSIEKDVNAILLLLEIHNIKSTFFCETNLLLKLQDLLKKVTRKGHEVSIFNIDSKLEKLTSEKELLEKFLDKIIKGIRQTNFKIDTEELKLLEFSYISDLEYSEVFLLFKKLFSETEIIEKNGISFIPESISTYSRIPYNDVTFQLMPQTFYQSMVRESLQKNDFVQIYLNTFQFTDKKYFSKLPFFLKINSGRKMEDKLSIFLEWINENEIATSRIKDFVF